jgi:hypothetical protein
MKEEKQPYIQLLLYHYLYKKEWFYLKQSLSNISVTCGRYKYWISLQWNMSKSNSEYNGIIYKLGIKYSLNSHPWAVTSS